MEDKRASVHRLIEESRTDRDYFLLLVISSMISTIGLVLGNASVIIGGMLISPLLTPLMSLGLSIITNNHESLLRSMKAIGKSLVIVLGISFATSFIIGFADPSNPEILSRAKPSLLYLYIAILSGIGATYAWVRPKISASIPGIAVAIALVPPLCTVGIGLSQLDRTLATGALQMFLINALGIVGSSTILFSLFGFHDMRAEEQKLIEEEAVLAEAEKQVAQVKKQVDAVKQEVVSQQAAVKIAQDAQPDTPAI